MKSDSLIRSKDYKPLISVDHHRRHYIYLPQNTVKYIDLYSEAAQCTLRQHKGALITVRKY